MLLSRRVSSSPVGRDRLRSPARRPGRRSPRSSACPAAASVTSICIVTDAPAASVPTVQRRLVASNVPTDGRAATNVSPAGSWSSTITFVAVDGPRLLATTVNVAVEPSRPCGRSTAFVIVRSIDAADGAGHRRAAVVRVRIRRRRRDRRGVRHRAAEVAGDRAGDAIVTGRSGRDRAERAGHRAGRHRARTGRCRRRRREHARRAAASSTTTRRRSTGRRWRP